MDLLFLSETNIPVGLILPDCETEKSTNNKTNESSVICDGSDSSINNNNDDGSVKIKRKRKFQNVPKRNNSETESNSTVENSNSYFCGECGSNFMSYELLESHLIDFHVKKLRKMQCDKCTEMFESNITLEEHSRICHTDSASDRNVVAKVKKRNSKSKGKPSSNASLDENPNVKVGVKRKTKHSTSINVPNVLDNPREIEQQLIYMCKDCGKILKTSNGLKIHISKSHNKREEMSTQRNLIDEQAEEKADQNGEASKSFHSCYLCNKLFVQKERLIQHIRQFHKVSMPYHCGKCLKHFRTLEEFGEHESSCESTINKEKVNKSVQGRVKITKSVSRKSLYFTDRFKCKQCHKQLSGKRELSEHMNVHTGDHSNLSTHVRSIHLKIVNFRCAHCDKGFLKNAELKRHIFHHHTPKPKKVEKIYNCRECGDDFTSYRLLRSHTMQMHVNRKLYQCQKCKKHLSSESIFKQHQFECLKRVWKNRFDNNDKDNKKFSCKKCGESFNRMQNLRHHISRLHTKKRNFTCVVCNKSFRMKKYLKLHLNIHSGNRPFSCKHCEKSYKDPATLRKHVQKLHPNIGTFRCIDCVKCFESNFALLLHIINRHEKDLSYKCVDCTAGFPNYGLLEKHTIEAHIDKQQYDELATLKDASRQSRKCKLDRTKNKQNVLLKTVTKRCHKQNNSTIKKKNQSFKKKRQISKSKLKIRKQIGCMKKGKVEKSVSNASKLKFVSRKCINNNQNSSPKKEDFRCENCNGIFSFKSSLRYHIRKELCVKRNQPKKRKVHDDLLVKEVNIVIKKLSADIINDFVRKDSDGNQCGVHDQEFYMENENISVEQRHVITSAKSTVTHDVENVIRPNAVGANVLSCVNGGDSYFNLSDNQKLNTKNTERKSVEQITVASDFENVKSNDSNNESKEESYSNNQTEENFDIDDSENYLSTNSFFPETTNISDSSPLSSSKDEAFYCDICDLWFSTDSKLKTPYKLNHESTDEFTCGECEEKFSLYEKLMDHLKLHS